MYNLNTRNIKKGGRLIILFNRKPEYLPPQLPVAIQSLGYQPVLALSIGIKKFNACLAAIVGNYIGFPVYGTAEIAHLLINFGVKIVGRVKLPAHIITLKNIGLQPV